MCLENGLVMTRAFPDAFQEHEVLPVNHYPADFPHLANIVAAWRSGCADCVVDARN